jgi:tetratricopeptide (TPR) repeat protein
MEPRQFPYGGVPVYNPQSLSKTEALAQFHARQAAYQSLIDLLREERPSHVLIIGTRGMGKTTLLQRVRYGVEDDAELNSRYLVLAFPEEQYNVNRLHHFLLNTVDALADSMERLKDDRMLAYVEKYVEAASKATPEEIEEQVPPFLAQVGQQLQKSFLLLVDNADRLFETIEDRQQWKLRELLAARPDLTLFGATTQASDGIYGPDRAFFEFFQIHRLAPLTLSEVRDLLLQLSESVEEKESEKGTAKRRVAEWLDADAARLRTLVQLTGGNPRTTVLLFHLVLDGLSGGAREYLEQLLDQVTPTYKGRVDELPAQAQQVLDAVALRWDPVTAFEVAGDTGLETSAVSTQLTRLARQGILEKADPGDSKKALYQVAERFFNIWYLMRASRRVRAKLRWFVEFLRVFFDSPKLEQMAWDRIERYQSTWRRHPEEIETAFAYVLASRARRDRFEYYLRQKCADSEEMWRPLLDTMDSTVVDAPESGTSAEANEEAELRRAIEAAPEAGGHWKDLGRVLAQKQECALEVEAAYRKAVHLDPKLADAWAELGSFLGRTTERREEAEVAIRRAIKLDPEVDRYWNDLGLVLEKAADRTAEAEAAYRKAIELDPEVGGYWNDLGFLLAKTPERAAEAEAAYRKAIELDPEFDGYWDGLGDLLAQTSERSVEAEMAYRKAIELDPKFAGYWDRLDDLLAETLERAADAETAYRKAIELDPKFAAYWNDLGYLLAGIPERIAEAEAVYRKAIELDPKFAGHWDDLGNLLAKTPERTAEAEAAYLKAIELDPKFAGYWYDLGVLLVLTSERTAEAEAACRKAIELDPKVAEFWFTLGILLAETPERTADAETAFRTGIELDPEFADCWDNLGDLLAETPERTADAEAAYRKAIDLNPESAGFWNDLAWLLGRMPNRREEAEAAFHKAIDLDPEDAMVWGLFGVFLAGQAGRPKDAEVALLTSLQFEPDNSLSNRNLGVLLYCELAEPKKALVYLHRAQQLDPEDPVSAAILAVSVRDPRTAHKQLQIFVDAAREVEFWNELLDLCRNYPPFGRILLGICDLVQERDPSNRFVPLYRAVAHAQLGDFPRASVALEDALTGDPIDLLQIGQRALETFFAAAVKSERVRDCLEAIDKKDWKDAWRPFYEALRAVEEGSAQYLKRIAVEIRYPAETILRRIAPRTPDLPERTK